MALANLLIKPVYLLWVEVKVNNIVGPETYGVFASLFSICYIFQLIADPGLLNYNTTYISANRNKLADRLPYMLGLKTCLALLYILFMWGIVFITETNPLTWSLFPWVTGNVLLMSINIFMRSNISGLGKYRWDSFLSVLDKSLMIVILCSMIYGGILGREITILDFVKGQFLALCITSIFILFTMVQFSIRLTPKVNLRQFIDILKSSLPYAWLVFFMTIYTRIDTFMLDKLIEDQSYSAGVYAAGFRIFDAMNSFSYLFAVLLLPMFSFMISQKQSIISLFESSFKLLLVGICVVGIFFGVYSEEIMQFFYPDDYTFSYSQVFLYLMLAIIPMSMAYITGSLLTADGRLKQLNKIAIVGVVLNIVLNLVLIEQFHVKGAAIATLMTQLIMTIIQYVYVRTYFKVDIKGKQVIIFSLFFFCILLITIITKEYSPLPFYVNIGLGILISLGFALRLKLIELTNFLSLLRKKVS